MILIFDKHDFYMYMFVSYSLTTVAASHAMFDCVCIAEQVHCMRRVSGIVLCRWVLSRLTERSHSQLVTGHVIHPETRNGVAKQPV